QPKSKGMKQRPKPVAEGPYPGKHRRGNDQPPRKAELRAVTDVQKCLATPGASTRSTLHRNTLSTFEVLPGHNECRADFLREVPNSPRNNLIRRHRVTRAWLANTGFSK